MLLILGRVVELGGTPQPDTPRRIWFEVIACRAGLNFSGRMWLYWEQNVNGISIFRVRYI